MTAAIFTKNWIMSTTSTPHRPEWAAKPTFSRPMPTSVSHLGRPKRMLAILHAARFTVPMMMQLKNSPRYTARKPRTTRAGPPLYRSS